MIPYALGLYHVWNHVWYHVLYQYKNHDISYDIMTYSFLEWPWYHQNTWYCTWDHNWFLISSMISQKTIMKTISCAITLWFCLRQHSRNHEIIFCYQEFLEINCTSHMLCLWYGMISAHDNKNFWYQSPMISPFLRFLWFHFTCAGAASWCGLGAPRARSSASSGLTAANELGTGVWLNGNGLDPEHGLVAVDAARSETQ